MLINASLHLDVLLESVPEILGTARLLLYTHFTEELEVLPTGSAPVSLQLSNGQQHDHNDGPAGVFCGRSRHALHCADHVSQPSAGVRTEGVRHHSSKMHTPQRMLRLPHLRFAG